jgi:hypothetical protein
MYNSDAGLQSMRGSCSASFKSTRGGGQVKSFYIVVVIALSSMACQAQAAEAPNERMFFPSDMFWGFAQFDLAPPHNEIDPNICASDAGKFGGGNAPCNAFARYMMSGLLEVRPFGRGPFRRFMLFGEPRFLFGRNVPQTLYTWSFDPIGVEHSWGAAIYLGKGFEARVTQHFLFDRFGARDRNLGAADLGPNGPWGRYNAIGVRKYFGSRRW